MQSSKGVGKKKTGAAGSGTGGTSAASGAEVRKGGATSSRASVSASAPTSAASSPGPAAARRLERSDSAAGAANARPVGATKTTAKPPGAAGKTLARKPSDRPPAALPPAGKSAASRSSQPSKSSRSLGSGSVGMSREGAAIARGKKSAGAVRRGDEFYSSIFRLFLQVKRSSPDRERCKLSKDATHTLNTMVIDLIDRLGTEAGNLCKYTNKDTMRVRSLQTAMRLVLGGKNNTELATMAQAEGDRCVKLYQTLDDGEADDDDDDHDAPEDDARRPAPRPTPRDDHADDEGDDDEDGDEADDDADAGSDDDDDAVMSD